MVYKVNYNSYQDSPISLSEAFQIFGKRINHNQQYGNYHVTNKETEQFSFWLVNMFHIHQYGEYGTFKELSDVDEKSLKYNVQPLANVHFKCTHLETFQIESLSGT